MLWSGRLALHLLKDRVIGKEEDGRYREMRRQWGARAQAEFFWYFQAQALAAALFSVPFLVAMTNGRPFPGAWDAVGAAVWLAAVGGEWLADAQLAGWRADPRNRGRTCRAGLWSWSRHPNYFFEWLHWWSYVLLAAGAPVVVADPVRARRHALPALPRDGDPQERGAGARDARRRLPGLPAPHERVHPAAAAAPSPGRLSTISTTSISPRRKPASQ